MAPSEPAMAPAASAPRVAHFRLGFQPDVGWLAGLPGITPLHLRSERFTARVTDERQALESLRANGFPDATLDLGDDAEAPDAPINV